MRRLLGFLLLWPALAMAQTTLPTPEEQLEHLPPALQQQAQDIWGRLKCVVCSGQSIAQSQAPLAQDIRQRVLDALQAGQRAPQIESDLAQHYGDAVLLSPPKAGNGMLLWVLPMLIFLGGLMLVLRQIRGKPAP